MRKLPNDLHPVVEMEQRQVTAKPITVAGRRGARVRPIVPPVNEEVRVPLGEEELRICFRPISPTHDAVFEQLPEALKFPCRSRQDHPTGEWHKPS